MIDASPVVSNTALLDALAFSDLEHSTPIYWRSVFDKEA